MARGSSPSTRRLKSSSGASSSRRRSRAARARTAFPSTRHRAPCAAGRARCPAHYSSGYAPPSSTPLTMVRLPTRLAAQPTGSCMLTPHPAPCIANVLYIFLPFGLATLGLVGLVGFGMFLQLLVDKACCPSACGAAHFTGRAHACTLTNRPRILLSLPRFVLPLRWGCSLPCLLTQAQMLSSCSVSPTPSSTTYDAESGATGGGQSARHTKPRILPPKTPPLGSTEATRNPMGLTCLQWKPSSCRYTCHCRPHGAA